MLYSNQEGAVVTLNHDKKADPEHAASQQHEPADTSLSDNEETDEISSEDDSAESASSSSDRRPAIDNDGHVKQLLNVPKFILQLLNSAFDKNYADEQVVYLQNDLIYKPAGASKPIRIRVDLYADILGADSRERYHIEVESTESDGIYIRMLEYGVHLAIIDRPEWENNDLIMRLPNQCIVFVEKGSSQRNNVRVCYVSSEGQRLYQPIRAIRQWVKSLEEQVRDHDYVFLAMTAIRKRVLLHQNEKSTTLTPEEKESERNRLFKEMLEEMQKISEQIELWIGDGALTEEEAGVFVQLMASLIAELMEAYGAADTYKEEVRKMQELNIVEQFRKVRDEGRVEGRVEGELNTCKKQYLAGILDRTGVIRSLQLIDAALDPSKLLAEWDRELTHQRAGDTPDLG
jgi:hypothetical protein